MKKTYKTNEVKVIKDKEVFENGCIVYRMFTISFKNEEIIIKSSVLDGCEAQNCVLNDEEMETVEKCISDYLSKLEEENFYKFMHLCRPDITPYLKKKRLNL